MTRSVIGLIFVALTATAAVAQTDPPPKDGKVTIPMLLSPAAPPVPASKYHVYPEYRDSLPGNKVQGLLRSFMEQQFFFSGEQETKRVKWVERSLAELPADVRQEASIGSGIAYPNKYTTFLANADKAARYTRTEWNEWLDLRKDGIYYLLPEVQKLRSLALAIRLRMRAEVKAGEWEQAVESSKTLFGMAQGLEQHPTLIGNLVGIAIASMAVNALEEMSAQPNAPSLYWALTDLPTPPIGTRFGLSGERVFVNAQFAALFETRRPLSDAELNPLLAGMGELVKSAGDTAAFKQNPAAGELIKNPSRWFARIGADESRLAAARKRIVARGTPADAANSMLVAQVGLMDELYQFEEARDELFKWYNTPYWQAKDGMQAADAAIKARNETYVLPPLLIAFVDKTKRAETRLTARVAQLRIVEAIRLHAQTAGGLPNTLDDIKLPLPPNPYAGQPFVYSVKDGVARLGPTGLETEPANNRWYELRLRK